MSSIDYRDKKYSEVFEQNFLGLTLRREKDASFTIAELEGILKHLYIHDGNDWLGRGELCDVIMEATINSHEAFLIKWRNECGVASGL